MEDPESISLYGCSSIQSIVLDSKGIFKDQIDSEDIQK